MNINRCKCGKYFGSDEIIKSGLEQTFTTINACPYCSKQWKRTKISGIAWKTYPKIKKIIESYLKPK